MHTAFRVGALPNYVGENGESEGLQYFVENGKVPSDRNAEWRGMVSAAVYRGARVARLRADSSPLSDYEKFELLAGYHAGVENGKEIHVTDKCIDVPFDFWAYDDSTLEVMRYDGSGRFLSSDVRPMTDQDRSMVAAAMQEFNAARPLAEFLSDEVL